MSLSKEQFKWLQKNKPNMSWADINIEFEEEFGDRVPDRTLRRWYKKAKFKYPEIGLKVPPKPHSKDTILTISDMHIPFHHRDSFTFLNALKDKYQPRRVVCMGDLNDWHPISFHKADPDLNSPGKELKENQRLNQTLEEIFPDMFVIGSNHGDLPLRKIFDAGLPREFLRDYNDIYGVGKGWKFVDDLILQSGTSEIYFCHGIARNGIKLAAQRGLCVVQGHYHTVMRIEYISNPKDLLWSMQVGCLIDKDSLAFEYGKLTLNRPIIGTGIIIDGLPKTLPMMLDREGRWTGEVP